MSILPKVNLIDFVRAVRSQKAPGNYMTSGLIIRKNGTDYPSIQDIRDFLPNHIFFEIDNTTNNKDLVSLFKKAFEEKIWLFLYLADGSLSKLLREQFLRLKNSNTIFIQGQTTDETFFGKQPDDTQLIVLIDEDNISKLDYPEFQNLFGPIIEV